MPSRNIAVRKDVYDALQREKRPGESFTKLLVRLLHQRGPLEELSGSWAQVARTAQRQWKSVRGSGPRR
ncbi:MAG: antitoxin VapB family protein [Thermoplasmata archaeon]|nr:antitoxin VapB family protein [Thermoplasmata archaeon]